ncbi:MAG: transposase family protein [Cyanobacteriota bacterium]
MKLRLLNEEACCSYCGKPSGELHQNRPILIRDLAVLGRATYLQVPRRQFYCRACQRYFTELLSFVEAGRHYTQRYELYIYQQVQQSSIEQVSRCEGLSWERIEGIFKHQYSRQKKTDGKGLNELDSTKSHNAKGGGNLSQLSGTHSCRGH